MRGNITRRGKNSWRIKIESDRGADGKRRTIYRTVRGRKADADGVLAEMLTDHRAGLLVETSNTSVGDYLKIWLAAQSTSPKTIERHTEIVDKHLVPALGAHPIQKLRVQHIDQYYREALASGRRDGKGGLSAQTVLHHHRVLFSALKHATKKRVVARNVAEDVDVPSPSRRDVQALDENQVARVITAAENSAWYVPILLGATTGLRRGEVLGLRWRDVDLERGKIHVAQVLQQLGKKVITKEPKTDSSRRAVVLPAIAIETLRRHRLAQAEQRLSLGLPKDESALVFANALGEPLKPSNLTKAFEHIVRKAGVPTVSLHALRHSHASQLLRSGINPKVVSERLGHSKVNITLDLYSKVLPGLQEEAASVTDAALRLALSKAKSTA